MGETMVKAKEDKERKAEKKAVRKAVSKAEKKAVSKAERKKSGRMFFTCSRCVIQSKESKLSSNSLKTRFFGLPETTMP